VLSNLFVDSHDGIYFLSDCV